MVNSRDKKRRVNQYLKWKTRANKARFIGWVARIIRYFLGD